MGRFVALSVGVHLVILFFLSVPVSQRVFPVPAEPVYEVSLVDWPEPNFRPPVPARPRHKTEVKKPKRVKRRKIHDEIKVPVKKRPKPKSKPREEKKPRPTPAKVSPSAKETRESAVRPKVDLPEAPSRPVSLGKVDQRNFRHEYYLELVRARLAAEWDSPAGGKKLARTTVHFIIRRDGSVIQPFVQEPSGWSLHDRAALAAVLNVKRFPPLPEAYSGDLLGISVVFQTMGESR